MKSKNWDASGQTFKDLGFEAQLQSQVLRNACPLALQRTTQKKKDQLSDMTQKDS